MMLRLGVICGFGCLDLDLVYCMMFFDCFVLSVRLLVISGCLFICLGIAGLGLCCGWLVLVINYYIVTFFYYFCVITLDLPGCLRCVGFGFCACLGVTGGFVVASLLVLGVVCAAISVLWLLVIRLI